MFFRLRKKIGEYYLKREQIRLDRKRKLINLRDARRIGILFTLDGISDYEKMETLVRTLQNEQKEIKALGFVRNTNLVSRFLPKLSYDFFSIKDLTWFYKPIHEKVHDLVTREFDILIDLSMYDCFPLRYIAGISKARCRVGRYSEENTGCFDLLIGSKPSMTIDDYFAQIHHYLTIINKDEQGH